MFTLELFFLEPKAEVPPANAKVKENPLKLGESWILVFKSHQFVLLFDLGLRLLGRIYPAEAVEEVEEGDHHVDEDDQGEERVGDGGHRTDCV